MHKLSRLTHFSEPYYDQQSTLPLTSRHLSVQSQPSLVPREPGYEANRNRTFYLQAEEAWSTFWRGFFLGRVAWMLVDILRLGSPICRYNIDNPPCD